MSHVGAAYCHPAHGSRSLRPLQTQRRRRRITPCSSGDLILSVFSEQQFNAELLLWTLAFVCITSERIKTRCCDNLIHTQESKKLNFPWKAMMSARWSDATLGQECFTEPKSPGKHDYQPKKAQLCYRCSVARASRRRWSFIWLVIHPWPWALG